MAIFSVYHQSQILPTWAGTIKVKKGAVQSIREGQVVTFPESNFGPALNKQFIYMKCVYSQVGSVYTQVILGTVLSVF